MPRQSAQPSTAPDHDLTYSQNQAEIEIGGIERRINENQNRHLSIVLPGVIERVRSLRDAEGALLGVCNAWGVVCRASVGKAPDVGSKLHSEPTLTSKCIESGRVVICERTAEDYQPGLQPRPWRLRSALVVPIHGPDSVLGVVEVLSSRAAAFSMEHVAELEGIALLLVPLLQREEPAQAEVEGGKKRAWVGLGERPSGWLCSYSGSRCITGRERYPLPPPIGLCPARRTPPKHRPPLGTG
jgi:GAF domain